MLFKQKQMLFVYKLLAVTFLFFFCIYFIALCLIKLVVVFFACTFDHFYCVIFICIFVNVYV